MGKITPHTASKWGRKIPSIPAGGPRIHARTRKDCHRLWNSGNRSRILCPCEKQVMDIAIISRTILRPRGDGPLAPQRTWERPIFASQPVLSPLVRLNAGVKVEPGEGRAWLWSSPKIWMLDRQVLKSGAPGARGRPCLVSRCTSGKGDPCPDRALGLEGGWRPGQNGGSAVITEGTSELDTVTPRAIQTAETWLLSTGGGDTLRRDVLECSQLGGRNLELRVYWALGRFVSDKAPGFEFYLVALYLFCCC